MAENRWNPPVTAGSIDNMSVDAEHAYRAISSRDTRFDGRFVVAVRTTGIYCRPSCPAMTPKRDNVEFFLTAAAAQSAGYRACRRCVPAAVPGSPDWDTRADLAARAMRLISDGLVEREGVPGLARRLGYSERQLTRVVTAELGAGPLALARAHRAHSARLLIKTTRMSFADIAFAAGFASVRQFNDTIKQVFARTPGQLRADSARQPDLPSTDPAPGTIVLRLPFRGVLNAGRLLDFFAARAIDGMENVSDGEYARTVRLPRQPATMRLRPATDHVVCVLRLGDVRDLGSAVSRARRLLDLDADPVAVDEVLGADPALADAVRAEPGTRVPGTVDAGETLLRTVLGQQVTVAAARGAAQRLTEAFGTPLASPDGELTTLFPTPEILAQRAAEVLTGPRRRVETVRVVAAALAEGTLDPHSGLPYEELVATLRALPGIGQWTADHLAVRALKAPDILLSGDVALRNGARALGLPSDVVGLTAHAERWRPWRSYACVRLWAAASRVRR